MDSAIAQAQASVRIFQHYFGKSPYGRIAITQQPEFSFGQSWPALVYLPVSAFLDATQRWQLLGAAGARSFADFIQEVTPHEVAHQWWGHIVGWSTLHDQWLSEGFSDFSAALYLHLTESKPDKFLKFWDRARELILEKNQFGRRANDAGPLWTGFRLNTFKNRGAYQRLVYPKGGYVLHMLRQMMWDPKTQDEAFIAMMRDFVQSHFNANASTESFKAIVEKHMTAQMDLEGNKRMDWFFRQWVYGTEVPRYNFTYQLSTQEGKFLVKASLEQKEVSAGFKSLVPLYADFDGKLVRLGQVRITGNTTVPEMTLLLPAKPRRVMINAMYDVLEQK
jgi:aminopeptidase N